VTDELRDCKWVAARLREFALGTLRNGAQQSVTAHLAVCPACRAAFEEEQRVLAQLDLLPQYEPSQDLVLAAARRIRTARPEPPAARAWPVWAAMAVTACAVCVIAAVLLPALTRSREAARRASAQNNLQQIGIILKLYANESRGGFYPPPAPYEGIWVPDLRLLYPDFLTDPSILVNPALPNASELQEELQRALTHQPPDWETAHRIAAQTIVYTGWALHDEADFRAFADTPETAARNESLKDIQAGGRTLYRFREGIERFLITDINNPAASTRTQSTIPLIFENVASIGRQRIPAGCHVLYLDGHVEFVRLGQEFPAVDSVGQAFPPPPLRRP